MNDPHVAHLVRQNLNRSARSLPEPIVDSLRKARAEALQRQRTQVQSIASLAGGRNIDIEESPRRVTSFVAVLLVSIASIAYWQAQEYIAGLEEVDSAILTDEMPLGAFVDKGFDAWRRSAGER